MAELIPTGMLRFKTAQPGRILWDVRHTCAPFGFGSVTEISRVDIKSPRTVMPGMME